MLGVTRLSYLLAETQGAHTGENTQELPRLRQLNRILKPKRADDLAAAPNRKERQGAAAERREYQTVEFGGPGIGGGVADVDLRSGG